MDKTLKASSIACCSNCPIKNIFMYWYDNQYYCSKCIDIKSNIKEYKYLI